VNDDAWKAALFLRTIVGCSERILSGFLPGMRLALPIPKLEGINGLLVQCPLQRVESLEPLVLLRHTVHEQILYSAIHIDHSHSLVHVDLGLHQWSLQRMRIANAVITAFARETGRRSFQPKAMSWSYRNRGSVLRIQT
jgi:hypothetical protein